jgi:hypothetical protein
MPRQQRLALNRFFHGLEEISRNLGLLFFATPLIEPLLRSGADISLRGGLSSILIGLVLFGASLTLAWIQKD